MNALFKKIFHRLLGWYVIPIQEELNRLSKEFGRSEEILGEYSEHLAEHEKRLSDIEHRERWARDRFAEHEKRLSDIEHREGWTRERFAEHEKRLSDIEHREGWTRERFAEHEKRLSDIEHREEWTRNRFEEHDEKIYENIRWLSEIEKRDKEDSPALMIGDPTSVPPSKLCTAEELLSAELQQYRDRLKMDDVCKLLDLPLYSRREWEFEIICRTLDGFGALAPGCRGIGFAVGLEPLPSYFALRGCTILASDLPPEEDSKGLWTETNQNAMGNLNNLNRLGICPTDEFYRLVSYRDIDMNDIPPELEAYDFCWSTCAIEHIGSLKQSIQFLKKVLKVLKPGGIAIHTTEINLSSDISTIEHGDSVIFRKKDILDVCKWMNSHGHKMSIDFTRGTTEMDLKKCITGQVYRDYMLNCNIEGYDSTSFAFIIVKGRI